MFDFSGFEEENGYSPDDETIPHMVVLTTLNNHPFKDYLVTSFRKAAATVMFIIQTQPELSATTSTVFKILNLSNANKPKLVARITDHPVSTFN